MNSLSSTIFTVVAISATTRDKRLGSIGVEVGRVRANTWELKGIQVKQIWENTTTEEKTVIDHNASEHFENRGMGNIQKIYIELINVTAALLYSTCINMLLILKVLIILILRPIRRTPHLDKKNVQVEIARMTATTNCSDANAPTEMTNTGRKATMHRDVAPDIQTCAVAES